MNFFSLEFIVFLSAIVGVYYILPLKIRWTGLLIASIFFYITCAPPAALAFILATAVTTWGGGILLDRISEKYREALEKAGNSLTKEEKKLRKKKTEQKKRAVFLLILLLNLGILIVLKYGNFIAENLNTALASRKAGMQIPVPDFLLPLGISFYTLQSLGYLIDVYRGKYSAGKNIWKHILFVTWFPQIIQGPINRYDVLSGQLEKGNTWDPLRMRKALLRMGWGYFKKIVVAERTAVIVNEIFAHTTLYHYRGLVVFLGALLYGVQIYADFSGGMDIVFGVSDMFGVTMTENFRQPYLAGSVAEFWKRWHITLGRWMRDYVFYAIAFSRPFGNLSKKMKKKYGPYIGKVFPSFLASFLVFMLVGIWHGADWKYIIYGTYHAVFVSSATLLEKPYGKMRSLLHIDGEAFGWRVFRIVRTVLLITFGRYFSRGESVSEAVSMLKATFSRWNPWILTDGTLYRFGLDQKNMHLLFLCILLLLLVDILNERGIIIRDVVAKQGIVFRWIVYFAAIFAVLIFGVYGAGYDAGAFIYQRF